MHSLSRFTDHQTCRISFLKAIIDPAVDQTIRRLREIDPDARVLLSSGYSQNGATARKLMRAANGFIQKPFHLVSLSRKIREILERTEDENP